MNDQLNAGFTSATPWIKVNDNKATINVESAEKNPNSTLNYFKKLTRLRKEHKDVLIYGKYTLLDANNPNVYSYTREANGKKYLVMLNFSAKTVKANTGIDCSKAKLLIGNYTNSTKDENLKPYEAVVMEL